VKQTIQQKQFCHDENTKKSRRFSLIMNPLPATTGPVQIFKKETQFNIFSRFFEDTAIFVIT